MVDAARFGKGMTFTQYVRYVGTPSNLKREGSQAPRKDWSDFLRKAYENVRLSPAHAAAWTWLVAQPDGPAKILAISEEWSSDCRRDIPLIARLADTVGLELRRPDRRVDGHALRTAARRLTPVRRRRA